MNPLFTAALEVQDLCRRSGWGFAWDVDEASLCTCSAEDLVVHKVFAGRDQDWVDVAGIIQRQRDVLDLDLILDELAPLLELKGSTSDLNRLRQLLG